MPHAPSSLHFLVRRERLKTAVLPAARATKAAGPRLQQQGRKQRWLCRTKYRCYHLPGERSVWSRPPTPQQVLACSDRTGCACLLAACSRFAHPTSLRVRSTGNARPSSLRPAHALSPARDVTAPHHLRSSSLAPGGVCRTFCPVFGSTMSAKRPCGYGDGRATGSATGDFLLD